MAKFKVGDRVKRIGNGYNGMRIGDEDIIAAWHPDGSINLVKYGYGHAEYMLELVTPAPASPIRTVTKREIVAGTYNQFQIFNGNPGVVNVKTDGKYICLKSAELRAAATLFNELADVLDENTPAELRVG